MAEIKWLTNGMVDNTDATTEFLPEAQQAENPDLTAPVKKENPMKTYNKSYKTNFEYIF